MNKFTGNIKSRLPNTGTSIFAVMSALAIQNEAINLSQGFPDFDISKKLIDLVHQKMNLGFNQYAPMPGIPGLRQAISKKVESLYQAYYNPETEITITAGATQALFTAITAFIHEGDEVIIFEPAYDSYSPAIRLNGGMIKFSRLKTPSYTIDWEEVQKLITGQTRMIIINTPHNPTGSVLSVDDLLHLQKLTRNTEIIVLSDEVYEHLIFDAIQHQSVCRFPDLAMRSLAIFSFGKTFHATGWKMGYVLAPENLTSEFRKVHQFNVFAVNTPIQHAIAEYLQDPDTYQQLPAFYQNKRDYFQNLIRDSRFKIIPSYGTYFQLLDYSLISDESETDFAIRLTKEFKIASIPISAFYHDNFNNKTLRFCFAKKEETLTKAAEIICKI